jgi:hypothetical protein
MAERRSWTGTAADLLRAGAERSADGVSSDRTGWPKNPRALAGRRRRAQSFLRTLGIEIVFGREGRLGTRTIRIAAMGENRSHNTVNTVRCVGDNEHGRGLNLGPDWNRCSNWADAADGADAEYPPTQCAPAKPSYK